MGIETRLTRREFFPRALELGGGALVAVSLPSIAVAQQSAKDLFRRLSPYDVKSLPWIPIEDSRPETSLLPNDEKKVLEEFEKRPHLRGRRGIHKTSSTAYAFKPEPDQNYARNLIEEAKRSIKHMFGFLATPYLPHPKIKFIVPKQGDNIKVRDLTDNLFYVFGGLETRISTTYEFDINGTKVSESYELVKRGFGEITRPITIKSEGDKHEVTIETNWPIFYSTSSPLLILIDAPPIEALHKAVLPYTLKHFANKLQEEKPTSHNHVAGLFQRQIELEEKFVHALSILRLRKYNKDRVLGLTEAELNERFSKYETIPLYKGANQLARYIALIGIQKAIELYVGNTDALFKVLE